MGATESKDASLAWTGSAPKYHLVHVSSSVINCLHVPEEALLAYELSTGDSLYMRDCNGHSFKMTVEKRADVFVLVAGWSEMLKKISCLCGDQLLLKFKAYRKCKVLVFSGITGLQKFPSTNGDTNPHIGHKLSRFNSTTLQYEAHKVAEGSRKRPIELDGPAHPVPVYNATDSALNGVITDFIGNIANTFDLKVPLYFFELCSPSTACDFYALDKEYGNTYLAPLFDRDGYPDVVNLVLNGDDEPYSIGFHVASDGTPVMSGGWSNFLETHFIDDGAQLVFRFNFGAQDVIIHVYDF